MKSVVIHWSRRKNAVKSKRLKIIGKQPKRTFRKKKIYTHQLYQETHDLLKKEAKRLDMPKQALLEMILQTVLKDDGFTIDLSKIEF